MSADRRSSSRPFASLYSHGFVRVAAAVPHVRIGEPAFNAERTLALARQASDDHAALVVFPELGLSGYSIDDLLHQRALLDGVFDAIERIAAESLALQPMIVVGAPTTIIGVSPALSATIRPSALETASSNASW